MRDVTPLLLALIIFTQCVTHPCIVFMQCAVRMGYTKRNETQRQNACIVCVRIAHTRNASSFCVCLALAQRSLASVRAISDE